MAKILYLDKDKVFQQGVYDIIYCGDQFRAEQVPEMAGHLSARGIIVVAPPRIYSTGNRINEFRFVGPYDNFKEEMLLYAKSDKSLDEQLQHIWRILQQSRSLRGPETGSAEFIDPAGSAWDWQFSGCLGLGFILLICIVLIYLVVRLACRGVMWLMNW